MTTNHQKQRQHWRHDSVLTEHPPQHAASEDKRQSWVNSISSRAIYHESAISLTGLLLFNSSWGGIPSTLMELHGSCVRSRLGRIPFYHTDFSSPWKCSGSCFLDWESVYRLLSLSHRLSPFFYSGGETGGGQSGVGVLFVFIDLCDASQINGC